MRIDAHQHFWDLSRFEYPWMPPEPCVLRRDYLPEHLAPTLERSQFDGSVAVQATTHAEEAAWLLALAREHERVLGVVGWVDLTDPRLGATLDRLQEDPYFVGVRHPVHDEEDDRWLLRPEVVRGLRTVAERGLPFDLLLRPRHLMLVLELAEAVPDLRLVLDHLGKPRIRHHGFDGWAEDVTKLSALPQVLVKLSGMVTEADPEHWTVDDLRPYVAHCLSEFGPDRCLYGSDWPVCLMTADSWKVTLAACTQALGPQHQDARSAIFGGNAVRVYGLRSAKGG